MPGMAIDTDHLARLFGLTGRVALVTGGARGIGLAAAEALGRAGASVVVSDLDGAEADAAAAGLARVGVDALPLRLDVADPASAAAGVEAAAAWRGRLDVVFSNAGNQDRRPFEHYDGDVWRRILDTHVNGAFEVLRPAMPHLRAGGDGRVILNSSVTAFGVGTEMTIAPYAAAKAALAGLTRALAVEYGRHGVAVNAVAPGFTRTGFTGHLHENARFNEWVGRQVPMARWGEPEEIAAAVLFLASPAARFITGAVLPVDGGLAAAL